MEVIAKKSKKSILNSLRERANIKVSVEFGNAAVTSLVPKSRNNYLVQV